ncbi:MAG: patatin-like phospholipase family protein [Coxiellaceae bacterium]|nr:patatin-like phospholipase family protein [Coxiellaceae bacterium]
MTDETVLVLGGGGSRGIAHIGVLQALEENNITIDRIVGTSAGSMMGALYAYHKSADRLKEIIYASSKKDLVRKSLNIFKGLSEGHGVEEFISSNTDQADFDQLQIPFSAVSVDLTTGELIEITHGPVSKAVQCSCALPPIFHPVKYMDRILVDGGAVAPVPAIVAKRHNPRLIIAVNVGIELPDKNPKLALGVMFRYGLIRIHELDHRTAADADVVIRPHIPGADILDDKDKQGLIDKGYQAALQQINTIKQLLSTA